MIVMQLIIGTIKTDLSIIKHNAGGILAQSMNTGTDNLPSSISDSEKYKI